MMKKFGLILLAVLLVGSLAFVGCGSSGNGNGKGNGGNGNGGIGDLPDELVVPANFEYDSTYTADIQWGGPNPTKPDGYQIAIYPFASAIAVGDIFEISMKFQLDRAAENIEISIVDTSPAANYWTDLAKTNQEADGTGVFDNDEEGLAKDTPYEFEVTFIMVNASKGDVSGDEPNVGLNFFIEADHLKAYEAGAGNVAAAQAEDFITITFTEFTIVKNPEAGEGELTGPQLAAKATIEQAFEDFEDEIVAFIEDMNEEFETEFDTDMTEWSDADWYAFFTLVEAEDALEEILEFIDLLYNPPSNFPVDLPDPDMTGQWGSTALDGWDDPVLTLVNEFNQAKYLVFENVTGTINYIVFSHNGNEWGGQLDADAVDAIPGLITVVGSDAWLDLAKLFEATGGAPIGDAMKLYYAPANPWGDAPITFDKAYLTDQDPPAAP